jgi:DNA-binding NtrC family response regulator
VRRVTLRIVEGPDAGREVELDVGSVIIGSHPEVDLPLRDPQVSRRHVEVQLLDDGVRVRDLGSKNGTFVEEQRIESAVVPAGGRARLGATTLAFDAADEPVDVGRGEERFGALVARSRRMRELFAILGRAAVSEATILLEGETGVGKDVLARTIHEQSPRKDGPFLVFDCGAVSPTLIAGELFGHARGAFTGANTERAGIFEAARGGTVFLDEVGELQLDLQPSLLRLLESRQVRRVGENRARDIDVRVIAATNRSLLDEARAGRFREDLYFRLAIIRLLIPPLRDRPEDLPALIELFLRDHQRGARDVAPSDMDRLLRHGWPGNVRELKNTITRACALAGDRLFFGADLGEPRLDPAALPTSSSSTEGSSVAVDDLLAVPLKEARASLNARFERLYAERALERSGGNVTRAAEEAGVARNYLHRLLKKHGLRGRHRMDS